ncbi:MAG: guanine deaminase [Phenylobacterium sp.]|nr:guanine deaminase [Phenylobacterium sp.]
MSRPATTRVAYRAAILHALDDPARASDAVAWHPDGLLVVEDGHVAACGDHAEIAPTLAPDVPVEALPGRLICPGFVDAHVHFPQVDVIGAWGGQLLDWLDTHTFPAEAAFADPVHARAMAPVFLDQLLAHGTTSALAFCSVHRASADALFDAALERNMRLIAGKVLMDRNAPAGLLDTVETGRAETEALIRAWRGRGRLGYAVTPRFAVTSSPEQLAMAGAVLAAHPDVLLHTHMSENRAEIAEVARAFPDAADYLDVYDRAGLVGPRSVFAHCVHTEDRALRRMAQAGSSIAFCPSSNLMLGSGLFGLKRARECGVRTALATDVGGGATFSMLATIGEAYRVGQLRGETLDPLQAFYMATLAGARALGIGDRVGNFEAGKEADFVVIDLAATALLKRRTAAAHTPGELLFRLAILADQRAIERTCLMGVTAYARHDH